ncbi:hypothetical protein ACSHXN_47765 (plasmid) [Streptomyces sp. HUAS TT11]|uniref:hypothetical protein n=1 Tax=Streptomyces sp. HUAS TT11 TaxID=3447508 RepID=UPI003F65D67D
MLLTASLLDGWLRWRAFMVVSRAGWQLLIHPDDFAVRDVAGTPSAGQLSDEAVL